MALLALAPFGRGNGRVAPCPTVRPDRVPGFGGEGYIGERAYAKPVRVAAKPSRFALLAPRQAAAQLPQSLDPPPAALPCSPYAYFLFHISFVRAKEIWHPEGVGSVMPYKRH